MKRGILSTRALVTVGLMMTLSAPAAGQVARKPTPEATQADAETKRLYDEGVKAAGRGQWEQARQAFLEAWERKPHYQIAANLGRAELKAGKPRAAVEHLGYFLREAPEDVAPEDRAQAEALLAEARGQVGTLALQVEPAGAEVLVDGEPVEAASGALEVPVDPGHRVIEARREGYLPLRQEVDVAPGARVAVALRLKREKAPVAPPAPEEGGRSLGVIGVGLGVTVAAAGAGVVLVVLGMGKASELDDFEENAEPTKEDKDKWLDLEQSRANLLNAGTWSLIGAGVVGGATAVYALTGKKAGGEPPRAGQIRVYPAGAGIAVSGRW